MRELDARLKRIDARVHNRFAAEASLQGIKIPFKTNQETMVPEFTPEQDAFISDRLKEAQERKLHEMRQRNG